MKRIIEIPDKVVEAIQNGKDYRYDIHTAIAQSKPYEPMGDLISREALKEQVKNEVCEVCFDFPDERQCSPNCKLCTFKQLIDNAQAVDLWQMRQEATENALKKAEVLYGRPQGECRTCRHRDPEDKKCDCGGLERHGCSFPVSDDYYCKFYEKGSTE